MPTDDDLPLNVPGNPYDPIFARRIEALGGRAGASPTPPQPRKGGGGGGGGWGGGLVAVIIVVNLMRSCGSTTSSDQRRHDDHPDWSPPTRFDPQTEETRRFLEQMEKANQQPRDLGDDNLPAEDKPAEGDLLPGRGKPAGGDPPPDERP